MEAINERGVGIDLEMAKHAAQLAATDKICSNAELREADRGAVTSRRPGQASMTDWLVDADAGRGSRDPDQARRGDRRGRRGHGLAKYSLTRKRVERLIALCNSQLDCRRTGSARVSACCRSGSTAAPRRRPSSARCSTSRSTACCLVSTSSTAPRRPAAHPARASRSITWRATRWTHEHDPIEALLDGVDYDNFATLGDDDAGGPQAVAADPAGLRAGAATTCSSGRTGARSRPASLPWLCDHYAGARARLQIFRDVDADPSTTGYLHPHRGRLSHIPVEQVTKPIRQRGKVAELALASAAASARCRTWRPATACTSPDDEAKAIVDRWRKANPWAVDFSQELWTAMMMARRMPGEIFQAGRISLVFIKSYLGGSLLCRLPSGRFLTYRALREERVEILNDDDEVIGTEWKLTFRRGHGRIVLWPGLFVENFTQAAAADILRGTLVRLETNGFNVRLHTHDEILMELTSTKPKRSRPSCASPCNKVSAGLAACR